MGWNNMTTALVTGGCGLIGSHLVKKLLDQGQTVIVADDLSRGTSENIQGLDVTLEVADLTRPPQCESLFAIYQIDEVYHLAAFLGGVEFIQKYPVEAYHKNLMMNMNVLDCCRAWEIKKLLFTSTACVYPVKKQLAPDSPPLKESDVYPLEPESGYGWAKLITEFLCDSYIREYGLKIGIVRMFNVYGPGESYNDNSHVIPMLCRKALNYPREPFEVWGYGDATRSFIYVEDAVDGIQTVMEKGINQGAFNVGTPERFTIKELANTIVNLVEKRFRDNQIEITYNPDKPVGVIGRAADTTRARSIGWRPKYSLEEGLVRTLAWMDEDMKRIRKWEWRPKDG